MNDGTFKKMEQSDKPLYGPAGIIVCGYEPSEHNTIAGALNKMGLGDRPLIFATPADLDRRLADVLTSEDRHGVGVDASMPRAMIMSGFTHKEVRFLMSVYRKAEMPRQLWATLTPVSETWTLEALLKELAAEAAAINNKRKP